MKYYQLKVTVPHDKNITKIYKFLDKVSYDKFVMISNYESIPDLITFTYSIKIEYADSFDRHISKLKEFYKDSEFKEHCKFSRKEL